ncbi:MAG: Carbamoyl-phosphate synthase small chain [Elusimicrobia bacterium]|nr:Carbamoyl-phosphate synthase small chain [Elusimicrobiota bacterium]
MAEIIQHSIKGVLALATGKIFQGTLFGAVPSDKSGGEVVFNTSLTGYQEILTDPSYHGQIVVMTPSHIGNTGVNPEDVESRKIFLSGFVVQEISGLFSNWRATGSLSDYLAQAGVAGLSGVDTRALTRYLRTQGAVNGVIAPLSRDLKSLIKLAKAVPSLEGRNLAAEVTSSQSYTWNQSSLTLPSNVPVSHARPAQKMKVVVMDFGVKQNILRCLVDLGCEVRVVPSATSSDQILDYNPDGILLSNGPGDPAAVEDGIKTIETLIKHNLHQKSQGNSPIPMFGICLGNQLLGLALGGNTYKLKFGHHGANHPIKELETGRVDITSQNHGFAVEGQKTGKGEWIVKGNKDALVTHINLNDEAIEGLRHKTLPLFSVQYHPEASAGPHDARHLFNRFYSLMENYHAKKN